MLARRLTTILPAMSLAEAIETTHIHRLAGLTGDRAAWVTTRPCRVPHHTISKAGLLGGGHVPMLGEASACPLGQATWDRRAAHGLGQEDVPCALPLKPTIMPVRPQEMAGTSSIGINRG